jgi:hypothetical protein
VENVLKADDLENLAYEWAHNFGDLWPTKAREEADSDEAAGHCARGRNRPGATIAGDPSRQNAGGFAPVFSVYVDQKKRCQHCGASYLFTAAEQKFWYEELGFYTRSEPTGCHTCRRKLRHHRRANQLVAERLEAIDTKDWRALKELSHLYLQLGSKRKAIETLRRAKNLCGPDEESQELLRREIRRTELCPTSTLPRYQFSRLGWISSDTKPEHFKYYVSTAQPMLSAEGQEILAEVVRRWTKARYGKSR